MKTPRTKNIITMKTLYFFLAFSGLVATTLFAFAMHGTLMKSNVDEPMNLYTCNVDHKPIILVESEKSNTRHFDFSELAPAIPSEADFSDAIIENVSLNLLPSTPLEASFEEEFNINDGYLLKDLSPVTPSEADFNDSEISQPVDASSLNPVTPAEADFEDLV